ncbi:MAG: lysophospholipid acyltransferase family protein [Myxococcota bacterium]
MDAPAPKTSRLEWFVPMGIWYARSRLKRSMDGVFVSGLGAARRHTLDRGILFASNHVSWWDPFLIIALNDALGTSGYALMDAQNLEKLPFFGWLGAIPIDRSSPGRSRSGLKTAAALLRPPKQIVWLFPQGRQRPSWVRPLDLKPGVRLLARLSEAPVMPVSLTYAYRDAEQPSVMVSFGEPLDPKRRDLVAALEDAIIQGLERNDAFLEGQADFDALIAPQKAQQQDSIGARILTLIGRSTNR